MEEIKYFRIHYSCGCGESCDFITAKNQEDADHIAYEHAIDDYHSFEGYHGVRDIAQVAEEVFGDPMSGDDYDLESLTEEEMADVEDAYNEIIENEIDYYAVEITKEEYEEGIKYGY